MKNFVSFYHFVNLLFQSFQNPFKENLEVIYRRLQFEKIYFVEMFEIDLFRKRVRKVLFRESMWKGLMPKPIFRKSLCTKDYLNAPK